MACGTDVMSHFSFLGFSGGPQCEEQEPVIRRAVGCGDLAQVMFTASTKSEV